jgi:hypothetical protein
MTDLEEYLRKVQIVVEQCGKLEGAVYKSMYDLLLREGKQYPYRPLPETVPRGQPRQCFANAQELALLGEGYTYCEGFAIGVIPTHHGWCIDEEGYVVDPTWEDGTEYWGVAFDREFVSRAVVAREMWGSLLDDLKYGWLIMKGEISWEDAKAKEE